MLIFLLFISYNLYALKFQFFTTPGIIYDLNNNKRYILQCQNYQDSITPCNFTLNLESGTYLDNLVLQIYIQV